LAAAYCDRQRNAVKVANIGTGIAGFQGFRLRQGSGGTSRFAHAETFPNIGKILIPAAIRFQWLKIFRLIFPRVGKMSDHPFF